MEQPDFPIYFAYGEQLIKMKLFCHSSCYSECSVLEQQISDQQFGNGEFIYTFRDSGALQQQHPSTAHLQKDCVLLSRHGTEIHSTLCWYTI